MKGKVSNANSTNKDIDWTGRYKSSTTALAVTSVIAAMIIVTLLCSTVGGDLQQASDCRVYQDAYSEDTCKYAGLMSMIFMPTTIVFAIAFVGLLLTLINRILKMKKTKLLDNKAKLVIALAIIACATALVFCIVTVVRWLVLIN